MIKLTENTLSKITSSDLEIEYLNSRCFNIKRHLKKAQKRTGLTRQEIGLIVSREVESGKNKAYLDHLTSIARFKKQGDIRQSQYETIITVMSNLKPVDITD